MKAARKALRESVYAAQAKSRRLVARSGMFADHSVALTLAANVDAPSIARDQVAQLAISGGASGVEVDAVKTAVSEAVSNSVRHAYEPGAAGLVYIDAYVVARILTILVADDGRGPRLPSPNPGLGLGWKLMIQLSDRCTVSRRGGGGTLIYMRFRLAGRTVTDGSGSWI